MEWHEAVGAASAILTFVAFSYDAIKVFREVADKGSTAENDRSALLAEDSKAILDSLRVFADADHTGHAAQISKLAGECQDDGKRLVELLDKLKILPDGNGSSSPPRKTIRTKINETANRATVAAKSMFHRSEINALEERLRKASSAIVLRLTVLLNERQLATSLKLESIRGETRQQSQVLSKQMTSLEDVLSKLSVCQPTAAPASGPPEASTAVSKTARMDSILPSNSDFKRLSDQIGELLRASSGPSPEIRILKKLYFPSMFHREDHMNSAEEGTFKWLLEKKSDSIDISLNGSPKVYGYANRREREALRQNKERDASRTRLLSWLRTGHGVFHVSGKAGAGKSTLMKLLVHHRRVQEELKIWADGKTLLFGHFFFWRSGDKMQNSLEGLYRSILFETLSKSPELLQHVFPEAYHKFSYTSRDDCIEDLFFRPENLKAAAQKLARLSLPDDCRLCLFIDGLDEYGEDGRDKQPHEELAGLLSQWGSSDRVKLLVSSRAEREFNIAFSNTNQRIDLHTLTYQDILLYADQSLRRHRDYCRIATNTRLLTQRVAFRAEGVFVWAKFAVDTLCRALGDALFDIEELFKELETLPDEMDQIYVGILKKNKSLRESRRACWLLQAVCSAGSVFSALHPLFVLQIDHWHSPSFPFAFQRQEWTRLEAKQRLSEAIARVNGLSGGLVEFKYNNYGDIDDRDIDDRDIDDRDIDDKEFEVELQPFHRTLRDFVFGNPEFAALVPETEKTYSRNFFFRIAFTNVWFSCADLIRPMNDFLLDYLENEIQAMPSDIVVRAFEHDWALQLFTSGPCSISKDCLGGRGVCTKLTWSLPHFAVAECYSLPTHRLVAWAESENKTKHADGLSLLVSAALGQGCLGNPESLPELLRRLSPNRLVALTHNCVVNPGKCPMNPQISVWMAICMGWIDPYYRYIRETTDEYMYGSKVCNFIKAGADCNFFILYTAPEKMFFEPPPKSYAVSAPDGLRAFARLSGRSSKAKSSSWEAEVARLLEATDLIVPMSKEWAQHGIIVADEQVRRQLLEGPKSIETRVCGLARGVREPNDGSILLEVTWTEGVDVRMY